MKADTELAALENLAYLPVFEMVKAATPLVWLNPKLRSWTQVEGLTLNSNDYKNAIEFMQRYAPCITQIFPTTSATQGKISSPLIEINRYRAQLNQASITPISGKLLLKADHALAVAGSIKARGGFFEILKFAHQLCVQEKLICDIESADFCREDIKKLLGKYTIGVGSTGNLGMSIGIISAKLGFQTKVYMSRDAKAWKKERLRLNGAEVIEENGDFSAAILRGRIETRNNPFGYFVDDERSSRLFLGYSLAANELKTQLQSLGISIDTKHPLFVYQPCGVGGSPGGVMWGLKQVFGDAVHCFFVEPTHSPSVLLGLLTEKYEKISVQDIGLDNYTEADGLAVGRPSAFASNFIRQLVSGIYTIEDKELLPLLQRLYKYEGIFVEPSATVGLLGPEKIGYTDYGVQHQIDPQNITHLVWSTGGGLMPEELQNELLAKEV